MARFTGIPEIPQGGIDDWQYRTLDTLKQNVELLAGIRGEADGASAAVLRSSVTTRAPTSANFQGLSATGAGFTISNVQVPSLDDYTALLRDFQALAQDVANLRATVASLINQIRGS
jgi:hypothetical protein